jgi:hypothetical protein
MPLYKTFKQIVKWCIPHGLVECRKQYIAEKSQKSYQGKKERIRNYFLSLNPTEQEQDVREIIEYFKENSFSVFPYAFASKYSGNAFYDETCDMHYVLHKNKRLYFPKNMTAEAAYGYYKELCIEQDEDSPHRYETKEFTVKEGDVIADVGAAEGIWALTYVEQAKKIYLFECNSEWLQALQKTFEPWKEKVAIINKYVSDISDGTNITLDDCFKNETLNFVKADVEGYELKLLDGGIKTILREKDIKLLLCSYHKKGDAEKLKERLEEIGFIAEYSKGYMLFIYDDDLEEPYIRRGLVRARKN